MIRRLARAGCFALAAMVFLGGCSSIFARTAEEMPSPTPAPQETVPQRGGDLFIAVPEVIESFDPLDASSEDLINFFSLIYETPFTYDATGRMHESLIESWDVSPDGRTFTFHVRDDVYFSDGTPLGARDVYESAQRALDTVNEVPEEPTPVPEETLDPESSASPTPVPTRRPSATYAQRFSEYGRSITDIEQDGDTIIVRTDGSGDDVLRFMTFPVTRAGFSEDALPIGTGPYKMTEPYEEGSRIALEINTSWWKDQPYIERIVAVPAEGDREKIEMQQTSLIDFLTTDALNAGNYAISGTSKVIDFMTNYFDCLVPNLTVPGLNMPEVRRAISDAIDRRELLSTVLLNHGVPSNLPIAPDSFVMDARFRTNQQNIQSALELLGQAGYRVEELGNGRTLSLSLIVPDALDSTYKKEAARAISKQLAEVYIEITVEELPEDEYEARLLSGDFDLAYCSYHLSTAPDLAFMLRQNGSGNYNGFSDMQVAEALDACETALTEQEMTDAYAHLQELLNVHMPVIGLYFRMHSIICDENIGGISGVREETVFEDIASWYTMFTTRTVQGGVTHAPTATAAIRRQTEPESRAGESGTWQPAAAPSETPSAFSSAAPGEESSSPSEENGNGGDDGEGEGDG